MSASPLSPTKLHATPVSTPPVASQYTAHVDESSIARMDAWESGLCSCFSSGVNCCMVFCLPCVSLAQISQRIGWGKYWHVLLALLGLYFAELFVSQVILSVHYGTVWYDYRKFDYDEYRRSHSDSWSWSYSDGSYGDDDLYTVFIVGVMADTILSFCSYLGSVTGLVLICVTWSLRSRVRDLFNIPGSCCGDCFASCCCSCCTVAQMATHVKSYKKGNCNFGPVDTLPAFLPQ